MDHSIYDKRKYPILGVREGYTEWVRTYEDTVHDEMDLRLLERLKTVDWGSQRIILDLACGTGRIGEWISQQSRAVIDGVDITPAMVEVARGKGIYRALHLAEVSATGLPPHSYDLCIQSLADEHLPDVGPLYRETGRLVKPGGTFVIVGYHPQFLMMGIPTHFNRASGQPATIQSYVHLMSDHAKAALEAGWSLRDMDEGLVDEAWLRKKPKWEKYAGLPISFVMVWQRSR